MTQQPARRRTRIICLQIAFLVIVACPPTIEAAKQAIDVGNRKQLFLDDTFIESRRNVTLTMNPPYQTGELLVTYDQPWEQGPRVYSSVLKHDGKVRIWYDVVRPTGPGPWDHERRVCYAESDDGVHFSKPRLDLHEVDGSKANNVVLPGVIGGCSVWLDPQAPPEHRYKTQAKVYPTGQFHMHSSPDGLHWKLFQRLEVGKGGWDTQSIVFWDSSLRRYLMYTRRWVMFPSKPRHGYRTVRRLESKDLEKWNHQSTVLEADEVDLATYNPPTIIPPIDYYGATVFRYPWADRAYIMLAHAFWHYTFRGHDGKLGPSVMDVRLLTSRDGKKFERAGARLPFLRLGPAGRFDSKRVWAMPNPIRMGDEIWVYYAGDNKDHNRRIDPQAKDGKRSGGISRAIMRLDGFVSADAAYEGGELVTPPIRFQGKNLELNVDTSGGSILVELLDVDGEPIKKFAGEQSVPLNGNSVRMPVRWDKKPDLGALSGKPLKIRFKMRDCKLYAFQFGD